jgi:hypothetical protein
MLLILMAAYSAAAPTDLCECCCQWFQGDGAALLTHNGLNIHPRLHGVTPAASMDQCDLGHTWEEV